MSADSRRSPLMAVGAAQEALWKPCGSGPGPRKASKACRQDAREALVRALWRSLGSCRVAEPPFRGRGPLPQARSHSGFELVDRSISRVLSWTAIHLGPASPRASSDLPGPGAGHAHGSLFGLAPGGVYPATAVASGAVRSYRTFSPLPGGSKAAGRYLFCGTFRSRAVTSATPRRYLAPCPMEPGLSSSGLHRQRLPDRPGADSSESG